MFCSSAFPYLVVTLSTLRFVTTSPQMTVRRAARLGATLSEGLSVGLQGELGAGKTWFCRGLVAGYLGDEDAPVSSPTYALLHEYGEGSRRVAHLDLYRIADDDDLQSVGFDDIEARLPRLIEWPSMAPSAMTSLDVLIDITVVGDEERLVEIQPRSAAGERWVDALQGLANWWNLGLTAALEDAGSTASHSEALLGRVVEVQKGGWFIALETGRVLAALAGRFRLDAQPQTPLVGDWVLVRSETHEAAIGWLIEEVLPRTGVLRRRAAGEGHRTQRIAANVDVALVIASITDVNVRRLERFLAIAEDGHAAAVVVLTKLDLLPDWEEELERTRRELPGVDVIAVSAETGQGVRDLDPWLRPAKTAVLLGTSGAGKSTLLNLLAMSGIQRTADVRDDGKGRHTTTARSLYVLASGACVIDTPGVREVGMAEGDEGVAATFDDIEALTADCRFADCSHQNEPGCAVQAAVATGELDADRLAAWRHLEAEQRAHLARVDPVVAADRKRREKSLSKGIKQHYRKSGR